MFFSGLLAALALGSAPAKVPEGGATGRETIELRWVAPTGCPDVEEARTLVERLVPGVGTRLRADVTIDAGAGGFVGRVALPAGPSPTIRQLQAEDCVVLARAMAVVIAVSLDAVAVAEAGRSSLGVPEPAPLTPMKEEPELDGERASAGGRTSNVRERSRGRPNEPEAQRPARSPEPDPAGARTPSEPRPAQNGFEGGLRMGAGVGGLLLPAAGAGLSLAPFLGTARIHVRMVAQYWAPQKVSFDPRRDAAGELQILTGGVRVCPQLGWAHVRIPLCAGADVGTILGHGTGRDLSNTRSAREPWVGAVLEPGVTVGVTSRFSLWLALEGVISLYRPRFAVEGAAQGWTAGAGAVRGMFGVQVHARRDRPQNP